MSFCIFPKDSVIVPLSDAPYANTVHDKQYKQAVDKLKTPESKKEFAERFVRIDTVYKDLLTYVDKRVSTFKSSNQGNLSRLADLVYSKANTTLLELRSQAATRTQSAFYEGKIITLFRDLDNHLAAKLGRPLHRYCGCNIMEEGTISMSPEKKNSVALSTQDKRYHVPYPKLDPKALPLHSLLNHKSTAIYSWSYGGGHDVVQSALAQRYSAAGMHVYNVQMDEEMLDCDPVWNLTGKRYSTRDLISYLMTNNWWTTIRFINKMFSGAPNAEDQAKRIGCLVDILLSRGMPDVALSCVARFVGSMEKAGVYMGIPYGNIPSDLDPELFDLQSGNDVINPHFIHGIAVRDAEVDKRINMPEEILADAGLTVRPAIIKNYSQAEVEAIRKEFQIDPNARVVLVLAGRDGIVNTCAEDLLKQYEGADPIHIITICGKNKAEEEKLKKQFASNKNVTVYGLADEAQMGKFYAIAAMKDDPARRGALVSAKGGGGTVTECIASGTPLLVSDLNGLHWERENIGFVERHKLGLRFSSKKELAAKLAELFKLEYVNPYASEDGVGKSLSLMTRLLTSAQADEEFQQRRKGQSDLKFQPTNK